MHLQDGLCQYRLALNCRLHRSLFSLTISNRFSTVMVSDACQVNNGDCDANALCSHEPTTNQAICTCRPGYADTGSDSRVICTRTSLSPVWNMDQSDLRLISVAVCEVKNGGCHANASCAYKNSDDVVVCTCKTGFTNTGSATEVICAGPTGVERASMPSHHSIVCR